MYEGQLFGGEALDYRTFVHRGVKLFIKLLTDDELAPQESDQLAEFLIFLACDLSVVLQNDGLKILLANVQ